MTLKSDPLAHRVVARFVAGGRDPEPEIEQLYRDFLTHDWEEHTFAKLLKERVQEGITFDTKVRAIKVTHGRGTEGETLTPMEVEVGVEVKLNLKSALESRDAKEIAEAYTEATATVSTDDRHAVGGIDMYYRMRDDVPEIKKVQVRNENTLHPTIVLSLLFEGWVDDESGVYPDQH